MMKGEACFLLILSHGSTCLKKTVITHKLVIVLISIDKMYTIILLLWTRNIYGCHCVIVW